MTRRLILHTDSMMQHDWPDDVVVQGGTNGIVFNDSGPDYTTAFVEAFPNTFLRGEGKTLAEAEDKAWEQFQHLLACPTYPAHGPFERRQYRNGAGYCVNCGGWFSGNVTGFEELPDDPNQPRRKSLMEQLFEEAMKGNAEAVVEILAEDTKVTDEDKANLVKAMKNADYSAFRKLMAEKFIEPPTNEGNPGDQADDGHGGREEQASPRDGA